VRASKRKRNNIGPKLRKKETHESGKRGK